MQRPITLHIYPHIYIYCGVHGPYDRILCFPKEIALIRVIKFRRIFVFLQRCGWAHDSPHQEFAGSPLRVPCTYHSQALARVRCLVLGSTPQSAYIRVWKVKVFQCCGNKLWYISYMFYPDCICLWVRVPPLLVTFNFMRPFNCPVSFKNKFQVVAIIPHHTIKAIQN